MKERGGSGCSIETGYHLPEKKSPRRLFESSLCHFKHNFASLVEGCYIILSSYDIHHNLLKLTSCLRQNNSPDAVDLFH